jgi:hypothetical protein
MTDILAPETWLSVRDIVMYLVMALVSYWGLNSKNAERVLDGRFTSVMQEFELRDQQITAMTHSLERASRRSSEEAGRVLVKIDELRERIDETRERVTRLEVRS